jgi:hypothetical protein
MSESHSVIIEMTAALIPMPAPANGKMPVYELRLHLLPTTQSDQLTDDANDEPGLRSDEQLTDVRYQPR